MSIQLEEAIFDLLPNAKFSIIGYDYSGIQWSDERPKPTEEEIQAKIAELKAAEPMRLLRQERTRLLQETDWMALNDVVVSEEWKAYRQALRDLPANSEPQLDENGNLTNVTWPTKPGENT